jgi:hypothetical protein
MGMRGKELECLVLYTQLHWAPHKLTATTLHESGESKSILKKTKASVSLAFC